MDRHAIEALDVTSPSQHEVTKLEQELISYERKNVDLKRRLSKAEADIAELIEECREYLKQH